MRKAICEEFSPQINKMLVDYAIEKGVDVYSATRRDNGRPNGNMNHIVFTEGLLQRGNKNDYVREELTVGEFLKFIDEISKPKLMLANHEVVFSDHQVKVGCNILSHSEVKEFIKEYQNKFGK